MPPDGSKPHLSDLNRFHQPTGREQSKGQRSFHKPQYPIARLSDPFHALSRNMSHIYDTQYMHAFHPFSLPIGAVFMQYTTSGQTSPFSFKAESCRSINLMKLPLATSYHCMVMSYVTEV
jgi:hypothetical protein